MATIVEYKLEDINKVIELMNTELSVTGIQNIKTIANIHEILTKSANVVEDHKKTQTITELFNAETQNDEVEVLNK